MTTPGPPDPVNHWATEHYGFPDEQMATPDAAQAAAGSLTPSSTPAHLQRGAPLPPRRRRALLVGAGLSVALAAGVGGVAVASIGADGDAGVGPRADRDAAVVRFDGDRADRGGNQGAGRR